MTAAAAPGAAQGTQQDISTVTVHTGGERLPDGEVGPLDGVTLGLYESEDSETPFSDEDWATCESTGGVCTFEIPIGADGVSSNTRLWVGQEEDGVPEGWFTNPSLRTGQGTGENSVEREYRYQTPELTAGSSFDSRDDNSFMRGSDPDPGYWMTSSGYWQQSIDNPPLPQVCGLNVALLLDLSGSMEGSLDQLKDAADTMVDSLVGSPSQTAVFSFASGSPAQEGENRPELVPVATQGEADDFKEIYADWEAVGGTNRDEGVAKVADEMAAAGEDYDLTVMITDGNPTFYADEQGNGSQTRVIEVEYGTFSANQLKGMGSRLMVAGVGPGIDAVTERNLRAMSGPVRFDADAGNIANADYLHADNFAEVGQAIQDLLAELCAGTLSVTKYIVPSENEGDDITGATQAGAGWTFDAAAVGPDGGGVDPESATTDDTGTVNFRLDYPTDTETAVLRVTEQQQEGYELVAPDGNTAICEIREGDGSADPHGSESVATGDGNPAFEVDVPRSSAVECRIYNKLSPAELTVDKQWEIDDRIVAQDDRPDGFDADLELSGPGDADPSPQDWGEARGGYSIGDDATGTEEVVIPERCTLDEVRMVRGNDPDTPVAVDPTDLEFEVYAQSSEYLITNEVSCDTRLTLVKTVDNSGGGTATPEDWVLTADGPTIVEGNSGDEAVTDAWVRPGHYELTERGPDDYGFDSWSCVLDGDQDPVNDGREVGIGFGDHMTCTVHNEYQEPEPTPSPTPAPSPTPTSDPTPSPTPTPSPSPTESPSPDPSPSPEPASVAGPSGPDAPGPAHEPDLPVTGSSLGGLVGSAALLLLAGALSIAIVWRRRTRPVG
ncbi:hypothetical protein [Nocardiopsis oceani]